MSEADGAGSQDAFPAKLNLESAIVGLSPGARTAAAKLNLSLSLDDGMYVKGGDAHYLTCGASALNVILAAQQLAQALTPASILDFGAGAGRVTRWLRAAFPTAHIAACDLRPQDIQFCRDQFGAETWIAGTDIDALQALGTYDLIWVGSVLTHLSAENSARLIDKLLNWANPGGLIIMSIIGRVAKDRKDGSGADYIHPAGWAQITQQYAERGFGYADYEGAAGYGLSLTKLSWAGGLVERLPGTRLVALSEAVWDDLHDIIAIQKIETGAGCGNPSNANAATAANELANRAEALTRGAAIEASTLWRTTKPLRSLARLFGR